MNVPVWIKKYPVLFFLALSLLVHLCALSATVFWERSGGRGTTPAILEFDYYEEETVEEAEIDLPSPEEEKAPELPKELPEEEPEVAGEPPPAPKEEKPPLEAQLFAEEVYHPPPPPGDRDEVLRWYVARLQRLIDVQMEYPDSALERRREGSVVVSFTLTREGEVRALYIPPRGGSSYEEFNREALRAVNKASSDFPPIPNAIIEDEITFRLPISFTLH